MMRKSGFYWVRAGWHTKHLRVAYWDSDVQHWYQAPASIRYADGFIDRVSHIALDPPLDMLGD